MYVANLPLIWPLLREWMPFLRGTSRDNSYQLPTHENRKSQGPMGGPAPHSQGYAKQSDTDTAVSLSDMLSTRAHRDDKTSGIVSLEIATEKAGGQCSPTGSSFVSDSPSTEMIAIPNCSTSTRASKVPRQSTGSRAATILEVRQSNEFEHHMKRVKKDKRQGGILTSQRRSSDWAQDGRIKASTTIEVRSNASMHNGLVDDDYTAGKPMGLETDRFVSAGTREVKIVGPQISQR